MCETQDVVGVILSLYFVVYTILKFWSKFWLLLFHLNQIFNCETTSVLIGTFVPSLSKMN